MRVRGGRCRPFLLGGVVKVPSGVSTCVRETVASERRATSARDAPLVPSARPSCSSFDRLWTSRVQLGWRQPSINRCGPPPNPTSTRECARPPLRRPFPTRRSCPGAPLFRCRPESRPASPSSPLVLLSALESRPAAERRDSRSNVPFEANRAWLMILSRSARAWSGASKGTSAAGRRDWVVGTYVAVESKRRREGTKANLASVDGQVLVIRSREAEAPKQRGAPSSTTSFLPFALTAQLKPQPDGARLRANKVLCTRTRSTLCDPHHSARRSTPLAALTCGATSRSACLLPIISMSDPSSCGKMRIAGWDRDRKSVV